MKKLYTIVILIAFGITQIYAQSCLQCTGTTATGAQATSVGSSTNANGDNSFSGGASSTANGVNSFAFGFNSTINGIGSIGLGTQVNTLQNGGIAIGSFVTSDAANSLVFGRYLTSTGNNSITLGMGSSGSPLLNDKNNSIVFGVNQFPSLTIVKPDSAALGYVGIGTDEPKEMAHVVGKLLIERTGEVESSLQFKHPDTRGNYPPTNDSLEIAPYHWDIYSDTYGLKFNIVNHSGSNPPPIQKMVISRGGSVGIGIAAPKASLHTNWNILAEGNITTLNKLVLAANNSADSQCWEISRTNAGLNYAYMNKVLKNVLFISNDGDIGVGKTTPAAMLDVNGLFKALNANISGTITANTANINTLTANTANIDEIVANTASIGILSGDTKVDGLLCAKEIRVALSGAPCWPDFVFHKDYKLRPLVEVEQFIAENQHLPNVPSSAEVEENGIELGEMNALLLQKVEELTLYIIQMEKRLAGIEKIMIND